MKSPTAPLVRVDNVTYTHWNQEAPSLHALSFEIHPGTVNVLIGPGGSGKSTLCSLLNGEIPQLLGGKMDGAVWVAGETTADAKVRDLAQVVGHVFQDPESMFSTLYVEDEIAFGPENLQQDAQDIRQRVQGLLSETQLLPQRSNLVWNLSGGQIQKLGLAAILAMQPAMIVLDEPTANLDPIATRSVHELIERLKAQGMTILLVTRELDDFILSICDQLLVLENGNLLTSGPPREVLRQHGRYILEDLGVWLPETVEIAIELNKRLPAAENALPFSVPDTLSYLRSRGVLGERLALAASPLPQPAPVDPLVTARDLSYTYANGFQALRGVSFDIHPGELLAIVGRNGAGKSTLARLLVGLQKPGNGALNLFGTPAAKWKVEDLARHIALVFQNPEHQFLTDTVFEEIAYSVMSRGISEQAKIDEMVGEMLNQLELTQARDRHPFSLSAGMKRRLGVATMLVGHPRILLVDEPTYGQDKQMTRTLMALMRQVVDQGTTVVMITHDMRLVLEYAQRVMVMTDGLVTYTGDPTELFCSEELLRAANLRPTLLQEMLMTYQENGGCVCSTIRTTDDLIQALIGEGGAR